MFGRKGDGGCRRKVVWEEGRGGREGLGGESGKVHLGGGRWKGKDEK